MTMPVISRLGPNVIPPSSGKKWVRRLQSAVLVLVLSALAVPRPATAQALPFDPACHQHHPVPVVAPQNALLLTKQPVPHPTGTATLFDIINLSNHVIPAGANSCVLTPVPAGGDYCFQARNDPTILTAGIGAIVNPGGLTACQ